MADALAYAHGQGVVHRDIKPENILLYSGHALVADFGIARALWQADGERLTETGLAVGTAAYMSPEQASGARQVDGRSDVYSLGCVLYEMLAGEPPYTGPTAQAIIAKRFSDPVPSVRRIRPAAPERLEQALNRALAPVAADRFATAADFRRALAAPAMDAAATALAAPRLGRHRSDPPAVFWPWDWRPRSSLPWRPGAFSGSAAVKLAFRAARLAWRCCHSRIRARRRMNTLPTG